jgi:hypothetical protein
MGTRGALGFIKNGEHKVAYNHFDSYPDGLGQGVLDLIQANSNHELNAMFDKITMVKESDTPTQDQIEKCKGTTDLGVSKQSTSDWYCLLREAQGDLEKYAEIGFMTDGKAFLHDSLFCEYAYIINLDTNEFEFYEGFQQTKPQGRYSNVKPDNGYFAVGLVRAFPLNDCPQKSEALEALLNDDEE